MGIVARTPPLYPPEARLRGYEGTVRLCFTVTARGTAADIRRQAYSDIVTPASPNAPATAATRAAQARTLLGAAAIAAVKQWRFSPREEHGRAVVTPDVCQDVAFYLGGKPSRTQVLAVQKAAAAGSAAAQFRLSGYYSHGWGVQKDSVAAREWLRKAAKGGNAMAEAALGFVYLGYKKGGTPELPKALAWLRKAAAQGNAVGEWGLAELYEVGGGTPRDPEKAAHWFKRAAEQGIPDAERSLAELYARGEGVDKNCGLALYWYMKASRKGNLQAKKALETFGKKGGACHTPPT